MATTATVPMTIGSSKGIALQLSLPSSSSFCPLGFGIRDTEPFVRLCFRAMDACEQARRDRPIGEWRDRAARLDEVDVSLCVEYCTRTARRGYPVCEAFRRNGVDIEVHIGEPVATEIGRHAAIRSGVVSLDIQMRDHSGHGVNLAASCGTKKLFITPEEVSSKLTGVPTGMSVD